jgi:phage terminase small subunit
MSGPLANPKHERFAQELAKGTKQFEAYAKVGYAGDATHASRLGARPDVQARVEEILGRAAAKVEVTVEKVLRELALLGFANMQDYMRSGADGDPYLDFSGLTREQAAALAEVTVEDFKEGRGDSGRDVRRIKFKLADKRAALVDIGRHLGMFKDKIEHSGGVTVLINGPDADL